MWPERKLFAVAAVALSAELVPAHAETIRVVVDNLEFTPVSINAKVGDIVEWVNKDILAHTATVKGSWDVLIPAKKSATLKIQTIGTVEYYCRFHPNMKGKVDVSE